MSIHVFRLGSRRVLDLGTRTVYINNGKCEFIKYGFDFFLDSAVRGGAGLILHFVICPGYDMGYSVVHEFSI